MSNTITKKILIDRIADSTGMKRVAVKQVVQEFLDQVIVELGEGNRLEFRDFGVFEVKQRAPRIAQNPKTLERVPVPAKRTVKFKVGRRMREAMDSDAPNSGGAAHIEPKPTTPTPSAAARNEPQREVLGTIRNESSERAHETAAVR
ncbi:MAG: HU family DNA-binding protein [Phycisphaerales bacterium JB052]